MVLPVRRTDSKFARESITRRAADVQEAVGFQGFQAQSFTSNHFEALTQIRSSPIREGDTCVSCEIISVAAILPRSSDDVSKEMAGEKETLEKLLGTPGLRLFPLEALQWNISCSR